ncbi:SusC/RagA family TonB-linked outer membrane protein [Psychroflexus sp. CAK57W]|uniref:SusC/RagA family TonB-linked outer membrane protein n=1 Tax=Psychroflexus curvus TaxID=2873595 RepID=UPI001CCA7553|nr:SusC/RagA family TonB-linked outer membrane protein [Psychroflexus curvus]MBZ9626577.1 SusC/RagA family TonB-linked outer membrane protein [Psychroflexus curvus]MBZ9786344.1 SusC/RagA family TonB-linked outer membrane protein [Psychroflexus curvus]
MKKMLFNYPVLILAMMLSFTGFSQVTVSGVVSDDLGPVPGVNIIEKGTSNGTVTGFNGDYTIQVPEGATLIFKYVGFQTKEVVVDGQTTINVTLEEDTAKLEEVVVIGYGTTTVKDATGSVSSVTSDEFNSGVISSPEQLIQGKTAGVQISLSSGEPGAGAAIRIRGSNSIRSNNNPLFVVDGIPLSDESTTPSAGGIVDGGDSARNPLSFINPNDIESISVLKDASATAIYGSRGANGVVIVTTKTGKSGKGGVFGFSSDVSISSPASEYDLFNANEYKTNFNEVTGNPVPGFDDTGADTDWQDVITRTSVSTNNNLTYSRAYSSGNLRASFSHANQEGVLEQSGQERIVGRINLTQRFFDDKLTVRVQSSLSRVNDEVPLISSEAGASGNIIGAAYSAPPTWPNDSEFFVDGNRLNPANMLANYNATTNTDRALLNGSFEYKITSNLSAKVNLGYDKSDSEANSVVTADYQNNGRLTGNGQASFNTLEATSKLLESTLNYKKQFDNSSIDLIVGYSFQDFRRQGLNSQGWQLGNNSNLSESVRNLQSSITGSYQQFGYDPDGSFVNRLFPLNDTDELPSYSEPFGSLWVDTFDNTDELQSFFGRANYSLNNKYLFTATVRADGSSRFGSDNRYGIFPSAAFAWKISEEDFIGENISTLKLRTSAGITGNQAGLGYANYLKRSRFRGPGIQDSGNINRPGLATVAVQNEELKWESTLDFNIGLDFGYDFDRLRGSLDLYKKETSDLLFRQAAAAPAFDPFVFKNLDDGKVINKGVELSLGYDFIYTEKSKFSIDFNIAYNDNTVEGLNGTVADFGAVNGPGLTNAFVQRLGEGRSLFSYYMAEYSEDANGVPNFSLDDKGFVDKDALPDITTGLSLNYSFGNFDASAFFAGQFGFYVYNNTANAFLNRTAFETSRNVTPEGLENVSSGVSTLYLEKGDFVRLQNLSLGYNVPMSEDSILKSLRFSLNGQNVFLITGYSGLDPEVSSSTGSLGSGIPSAGIDYTSFPRPRTVTFGLNAKF